MKGANHGTARTVLGCVGRWALVAGLAGLGLTGAHGAVVQASITGFVPNPLPATGGNFVRTGSWQWALSRAVGQYEVTAAGRAIVGEATVTAAATAGRSIATACFASGPAAVGCATVAAVAWYAYSRIHIQDDEYVVDYDEFGACYTAHQPWVTQGSDFLPCSSTASSTMSSWVNTANANNYGDSHFSDTDTEVTWSTFSVPGNLAVNSSASGKANKHSVTTYHNGSPPLVQDSQVTVTVYRLADQQTTNTRPATEGDMIDHGNRYPPSDDVMNNYPGPIPVNNPDLAPSGVVMGDPYPGDNTPNEGPWKQDRVTVTPRPDTPDQLDMDGGTGTVDVDNPNTPEDEGPGDGVDPGDPNQVPPEGDKTDLCEDHPEISACQPLGDAPDDEVPKDTANLAWQWTPLGLPSACPAPIPMGAYGQLTFDTACEISTWMSPLVVALGALSALMICIAAIRR